MTAEERNTEIELFLKEANRLFSRQWGILSEQWEVLSALYDQGLMTGADPLLTRGEYADKVVGDVIKLYKLRYSENVPVWILGDRLFLQDGPHGAVKKRRLHTGEKFVQCGFKRDHHDDGKSHLWVLLKKGACEAEEEGWVSSIFPWRSGVMDMLSYSEISPGYLQAMKALAIVGKDTNAASIWEQRIVGLGQSSNFPKACIEAGSRAVVAAIVRPAVSIGLRMVLGRQLRIAKSVGVGLLSYLIYSSTARTEFNLVDMLVDVVEEVASDVSDIAKLVVNVAHWQECAFQLF